MAGLTSMTIAVAAIASRRWKKPPLIKRAWLRWALGSAPSSIWRSRSARTEVNWARVWEGLPRGAQFFAAFFPPDFVSRWSEIADGILESLWMTVVSTVIGIALSIPVGIGAAKNIAPAPVYYFCRGILAVSRSFQEIILAIFFVKLFGFGPFAGVRHAVVRHHRLLRQAARRRHRGHGPGAGRSRARDRRGLAAMDQLRRPAAGDAAHDRARPLPLRHQLPRIRGGRHRRRRRHRRDARTPRSTATSSIPPPPSC